MQRRPEELAEILARSELLYSREQVDAAFDAMALEIARVVGPRVDGRDLLLIPVMKGGMYPAVHLMSRLDLPIAVDYLHATRYRGAVEGGELAWRAEPHTRLEERLVLVVDDIFDEGRTLEAIVDYCRDAGAEDVLSAALLKKRHDGYLTDYRPDFVGLEVADRYVFGCGMDFEEYFRGLPEIRALVE
jgi:hypoxanthine phosphoribosyltransferase